MRLSSIRTVSFRNLADGVTDTNGTDIFLVGENGQGKSNFIEAVYFSSFASSFRGSNDKELARNGEKDFSVSASFDDPLSGKVAVKFEKSKKNILINEKPVVDRRELLSVAPCIVFCHEDMEFVSGTPERRRWFFDQVLSLCDPLYLDELRRYRKVLKTRNTLLRDAVLKKTLYSDIEPLLDALDPQLIVYGINLMEKRAAAAAQFSEIFGPLYQEVSGIQGIELRYQSSWKESAADLQKVLLEKRRQDFSAGASLSGPHRDRYGFFRKGVEFTASASTGQRRLLALLLRSAQACRYREASSKDPVLLLDDVLLEMDGEKRRRFLSLMPPYAQAFFTFLPEEPYQSYKKSETIVYFVEDGNLKVS